MQEESVGRTLTRENMIRGVLIFTFCTLVGLLLSFLWSGTQDDLRSGTQDLKQVLFGMRFELLPWAFLCMVLDWFCGGMRFHIFVKKVFPTLRVRDSLRAVLATLCVSAITPFQTGGVGHLYIYARVGVPLSGAITSGIIAFLSTLIILIIAACGILYLDPAFVPKGTTLVSLFSFLIFSLVTTTFLLLLLKPEIVFRVFDWICAAARRRFPRIAPFLERAVLKVEELVTEHKTFSQMFIRQHKGVCALSLLLTCGFLGARVLGSYVVVKALNGDATLWELTVIGMLLNFVLLFAPTPGASGVAELATGGLVGKLIATKLVTPYVLLTRFFTVYSTVIAGGIVIGGQLVKDFKGSKHPPNADIEP